jgi:hypothetical protein
LAGDCFSPCGGDLHPHDLHLPPTVTNALVENGESSGRAFDALVAMHQAEAVVRALEFAGIRRRI